MFPLEQEQVNSDEEEITGGHTPSDMLLKGAKEHTAVSVFLKPL